MGATQASMQDRNELVARPFPNIHESAPSSTGAVRVEALPQRRDA